MAFVDSNQESPYVATNQSAPVSSGGAGIAGTATKPSANTPGVNVPAQPSAQLSAYLNANAPQAQGMAQQIARSAMPPAKYYQRSIPILVSSQTSRPMQRLIKRLQILHLL